MGDSFAFSAKGFSPSIGRFSESFFGIAIATLFITVALDFSFSPSEAAAILVAAAGAFLEA